jgi:hypothetical protein
VQRHHILRLHVVGGVAAKAGNVYARQGMQKPEA